MKKLLATLLGFWLSSNPFAALATETKESIGLVTAYQWVDLSEKNREIYIFGALESFMFRAYSHSDKKNESDRKLYSDLEFCLRSEIKTIKLALNNSIALGRSLEESFAGIIWDSAIPIACKKKAPTAGHIAPVRFVSHLMWGQLTKEQRLLYLQGYLDAQQYILKRGKEPKKSEDLQLYRQIISEAKLNEMLALLEKHGLEPGVPIPWSVARASGALVKRGPGYPVIPPSATKWEEQLSKDLVGLWGKWVDFEVVSTVCKNLWHPSAEGQAELKKTIHAELLRQHKCVANQVTAEIMAVLFSEMGVNPTEIKRMVSSLDPAIIKEKTKSLENHILGFSQKEKQKLCDENWDSMSHHSNSPYFSFHQFQYYSTRLPGLRKTTAIAQTVLPACKISPP